MNTKNTQQTQNLEENTQQEKSEISTAEPQSVESTKTFSEIKEKEELELKLKAAEEKAAEYYTYLQRLQADFDNYKRIVAKEKEEIGKYIMESVACLVLPIIDHLHIAKVSLEKSKDIKKIKEGVNLIIKQFDDFLARMNISEIDCKGKEFDPLYHEAVCFEEVENEEDNKILEVLQKGYKIYDKPIRCAKVKVGKSKAKEQISEISQDTKDITSN